MSSRSKSSHKSGSRGKPWSAAEHSAFLCGIERYGWGRWKDIADCFVPSRTRIQVATHGHKYMAKLQRREDRQLATEAPQKQRPSPSPPLLVVHSISSPEIENIPKFPHHALLLPKYDDDAEECNEGGQEEHHDHRCHSSVVGHNVCALKLRRRESLSSSSTCSSDDCPLLLEDQPLDYTTTSTSEFGFVSTEETTTTKRRFTDQEDHDCPSRARKLPKTETATANDHEEWQWPFAILDHQDSEESRNASLSLSLDWECYLDFSHHVETGY